MSSRHLLLVVTFIIAGVFSGMVFAQAPNTVLVPVLVTGQRNAPAAGLKEENFKITEDNAEQKIAFFSPDNSPASIGLIVGAGALAVRADRVSEAIRESIDTFQKTGNPANEYFIEPFGLDGMNGAAMRGLTRLAKSTHTRKALIILLDTQDNPGGNPDAPSMDTPLKQGIPIYFMFMSGVRADRGYPQNWLTVIEDVAKNTGGRVIYADPMGDLRVESIKLAEEIKSQYVIGYTSTKTAQDGKWRSLKVTVTPPAGSPKLNVKHKSRYFVAKP